MKHIEITPKRDLSEDEIINLEEQFPYIAETSVKQAYFEALSSGSSVLIAENDELVEVFPSGKKRVIKKIDPRISIKKGAKFKIA